MKQTIVMNSSRLIIFLILFINVKAISQIDTTIIKKEYFVPSTDDVKIQVKEIFYDNNGNIPLLMIHGGGPDAITAFDLKTNTTSFAEELSTKGFHIFLVNIRGWGKSTLPNYNLSDKNLTIGNVEEASEDINSVINWLTEKYKFNKVNLFGWAAGGHWIAYTAVKYPDKIKSVITLNSLYGIKYDWPLHKFYANPKDDLLYNKVSPFRESPKESLTTSWTNTIPVDDKESWRDPLIEKAYKEQACEYGDNKNIFKVPGGFQEESFYMALGKQYWNARDIKVPTLIIRSKYDFWSREIDIKAFKKDFPKEIKSEFKTINGTHYLFLDKEDKGKNELINLMVKFIEN